VTQSLLPSPQADLSYPQLRDNNSPTPTTNICKKEHSTYRHQHIYSYNYHVHHHST
jgi:hypothetical protein